MFRCKELFIKTVKKCACSHALSGCNTSSPRIPKTKVSSLQNGMRVATEESSSPLASVALFIEAGPVYENPANYGITHFIEHMAYRGFKSMTKQQLEDCLFSTGSKMSSITTREFQVFSGQCLVENVSEIVCILSKIVTELELSDTELKMAKCMIDIESTEVEKNPKAVLSDYLHETAFQCTPLGQRIMGPTRNLMKFNKHFIEVYMKENYYPARFVLATSGGVSHENMIDCAEKFFGLINQDRSVNYCPPQRYTGSQISYRDDTLPFVHVALAVEAPGIKDKNYMTMLLASNIIGAWHKSQGGNDRHGSPLARAAATGNFCESFESFYIPYRDVGLWGVYIVSPKMAIEDMIYNLQSRWMHLCITTTSNDVERGLNAARLEVAKKIEGPSKSCYDVGIQVLYNCNRRSLTDTYDALLNTDVKMIKQAASIYLYDKCPAVAAIGPTEAVPDYTRIRAGMYWLRL